MKRSARLALVVAVTLVSVGCDQAAKQLARDSLGGESSISLLAGSLHFELVENHGGFLSLGANLPLSLRQIVFRLGVPALLAAVALGVILARDLHRAQVIGLALLLGGGTGNLIDRVRYEGAVTDFVRLSIGPISTGVFNLSDLAIALGLVAFAFARSPDARDDPAPAASPDGSGGPPTGRR